MRTNNGRRWGFILIAIAAIVSFANIEAQAQKEIQMIQAVAMGTSTQLGRVVNVELRIFEYSTAEDREILLQAFNEKGSRGLVNALDKMKSKGRIAITGTLGYDVNFLRVFNMPDGSTKIRFVTDRPIAFGEAWSNTRSMDYSLSMGEIIVATDKKNSSGSLFPAAQFTLDKEKELTIETYQNPWKLTNIQVRK